ncbi:hypothetical protein H0H93_000212 [Arthromyces matolae]|nr:hypothetical protein H0H93_000212 [Arthromyces matolae]
MASLPTYHHVARILTFVSLLARTAADPSVDLQACLADIRTGAWGTVGGLDNHGHPISNISLATAISYPLCVKACGTGPEAFRWDTFSQQFGSWLLPWLALVSQLPFGTHSILQNFLSMMLAVGSPTLAAYSLVITVLNDRWVSRRFSSIQNPNSRNAVKVLTAFQQAPLVVTNDMHLLRSLVYLPENIDWWRKLALKLNYTHTWTISAGTSVAWVIIAYVFTVVDSLQGDITEAISAHGQGIGAIWLWLLPIVTGWLQTSPKCDTGKLYRAIRNANSRAHTITENFGTVLVDDIPDAEYALSLSTTGRRNGYLPDESCTAPIYNFSRHFSWSHSVEKVARTFETSLTQDPITALKEKSASEPSGPGLYDPDKTTPTLSRWAPGVFSRVVVASLAALFLQWGTTGGAMVINYHTPTYGEMLLLIPPRQKN